MADEEDVTGPLRQYLHANLSAHFAIPQDQEVHPAESLAQAVEAGWQMSTLGLGLRGGLPDLAVPENANRVYRIASQAATLAGDLPLMAAGGFAGGLVGGPAAPVTAQAGAFAAPAMMRRFMMDAYAKGGVKDFSEFWDRSSAIMLDGIKQGAVGAATGGAGIGGRLLGGATYVEGQLVGGTLAGVSAELATMLAVGNAVEGKFSLPSLDEFADAALLMGGAHAVSAGLHAVKEHAIGSLSEEYRPRTRTERKLMEDYARDGVPPMERAQAVMADPAAHAEYVSTEEQAPERAVGPLPEAATEATKIRDESAVSISGVLGDEGVVPPPAPEQAVPGYVPVFGFDDAAATTYFDRLREGRVLIRKPGNEVAFDPRTDTVVNAKTGAVEIKPTNAAFAVEVPAGQKQEAGVPGPEPMRRGRTMLHDPVLGTWRDKATGELVIPARSSRELNVAALDLEPGGDRYRTTRDKLDAATRAAQAAKDRAEASRKKLDARTKPPTEKMKAAHADREQKAEAAGKALESATEEMKTAQDRLNKLLAGDASIPATPEDLKVMSEADLRARVKKGEDTGELTNRMAARKELLDREAAARTAEKPAEPAKSTRQEQPERAAKPAPAQPPAPPSADRIAQAKDAILSRVSFDEPQKEASFLTQKEKWYRDTVDKNEPVFAIDKILSGDKDMVRSRSRLLPAKTVSEAGAAFGMSLEYGVPVFGTDRVATESFDKMFKDVSSGELSQKDYVAVNTAREALSRSRQVEAARERVGELPEMKKGDRFQMFDAKGAKSAEGKVIGTGYPNDQVKVRVQDVDGRWVDVLMPREDVRRNLIALVDGREVRNAATGIDLAEAQIVVDSSGAKYDAITKRFREWEKAGIQYGMDAKWIPEDVGKRLLASEYHTALHRVMETDWSSPLKGAEGSERQIINPFESMLKDMQYILRKSDENTAKIKLLEAIQTHPQNAEGLIRIIEPEQGYGTISEADFARISGGKATDLTPNDVTVLTQGQHLLKPNQMVLNDGTGIKIIEGPKDLIEAYRGVGQEEMGGIMKLLAIPAKLQRAGIVNSFSFITRLALRNPVMGKLFSENNTGFVDMFRALGAYAKKDKAYQDAFSAGAMTSAVTKGFNERGAIQAHLSKLAPETGLFNTTWNLARNAFEALHLAATAADNVIQLAEYTNAVKSGKGRLQAAYEARQVVGDTQRAGAKMRALSSLIPFLRMQIQGLDQIGQALSREGPVAVGMRVAPLMYGSALLWWATKDDSRMEDIPHEQRDLFWVIPTDRWETVDTNDGDAMSNAMARPDDQRRLSADGNTLQVNNGAIFRIPKPFEAGVVIASGTERFLEYFAKDNPDAWDKFGYSIAAVVTPNYMPAFAKPVIEQFANKSTFTGNPLISHQAERELPQYRYGDYTSETAKALGKIIAPIPGFGGTNLASPAIIENYVNSYGGYIGSYALELADKGLRALGVVPDPVKPEDTLADIPFVRAFVIRNPGSNTQNLRTFYDAFDRHQQVVTSIRRRAAEGDVAEMDRLMLIEARDAAAGGLDTVAKSLSSMGQLVRMIYKMPDMTPREKRQQIDGLYYGMTETAKMGLTSMREMQKELEAQ